MLNVTIKDALGAIFCWLESDSAELAVVLFVAGVAMRYVAEETQTSALGAIVDQVETLGTLATN